MTGALSNWFFFFNWSKISLILCRKPSLSLSISLSLVTWIQSEDRSLASSLRYFRKEDLAANLISDLNYALFTFSSFRLDSCSASSLWSGDLSNGNNEVSISGCLIHSIVVCLFWLLCVCNFSSGWLNLSFFYTWF